jgi:hypothetical protein
MVADSPPVLIEEPTTETPMSDEPADERELAPVRRWSRAAVVIWLVFAVGMTLFIAFARVPIAAGWRQGRSMRVVDIWSLFTLELSQVAGPLITPALATALVILVLAGSLLCVWVAMAVTSDDLPEGPD